MIQVRELTKRYGPVTAVDTVLAFILIRRRASDLLLPSPLISQGDPP